MTIEITYDIRDRRNKPASTSVRVNTGATEAQVTGFARAWATAINPLIGGVIRAAFAILNVDISALTNNTPASNSDVEEIGAFEFGTSNGITKVQVNIPAILETLINNDTGQMDLAAPQVAAFIAMMEDGITVGATLIQPCDVGGDDVTNTIYAKEGSRNSGSNAGGS